jgi:hypothetical protein
MAFPVKMTLGGKTWEFAGEDAKKFIAASGNLRRTAEELEAGGAEGDVIELVLDDRKFDASHVDDAVTCLRDSAFTLDCPKLVGSNNLANLGLGGPSVVLLTKYSPTELFGVFAFAEYLECPDLRHVCLVKLASVAYIDNTAEFGTADAMVRCNLAGKTYDMAIEKTILASYEAI